MAAILSLSNMYVKEIILHSAGLHTCIPYGD